MQAAVDQLDQMRTAEKLTLSKASLQMDAIRLVGTPRSIADQLEDHFPTQGCDGFVVSPIVSPLGHDVFCWTMVPKLQRRGLFRASY